jgi:hypothetical protein
LIRKQQGYMRRQDVPAPQPSLFQKLKSMHIRCAHTAQPGLGNNTDVLFSPAPQGPGSPSGVDRGQAEPCPLSGLVVIAFVKLPIPSRTRPISANTPMVLRLKTWESRSPPNLTSDRNLSYTIPIQTVPQNNANHRFPNTREHPSRGGAAPSARRRLRLRGRTTKEDRAAAVHLQKKTVAGWSSPVARQAHNLKVTGSNPVPATKITSICHETHPADQCCRRSNTLFA